jgi:hypothetical protein
MKNQRSPIQVFSLSFLDVISCAFGAVVMLILLAKNGDQGDFSDIGQLATVVAQLNQAQQDNASSEQTLSETQQQNRTQQQSAEAKATQIQQLENQIADAQARLNQLNRQALGLEQRRMQLRAAISVGNATERDEEVGGIPVNSDYVIFIIDTSGSMKRIWRKVMRKVSEVLEIHPQVKGFQIMSDNGEFLLQRSVGQWRKDTPTIRKSVIRTMENWNGSSNSSPVEGIAAALRTYAKRTDSLALYVFGDDFSGSSFDNALDKINGLNTGNDGKKIAQIHGIGFTLPGQTLSNELLSFATLMREVARQNGGTFIAQE